MVFHSGLFPGERKDSIKEVLKEIATISVFHPIGRFLGNCVSGEIVGRFGKEKQTYTRKHILTHSTPKTGEKGKFRRRKGAHPDFLLIPSRCYL